MLLFIGIRLALDPEIKQLAVAAGFVKIIIPT